MSYLLNAYQRYFYDVSRYISFTYIRKDILVVLNYHLNMKIYITSTLLDNIKPDY